LVVRPRRATVMVSANKRVAPSDDPGNRSVATGVPSRDAFEVDTPIGLVDHPRLGRVYAAVSPPAGKPSLTRVRVLEARDGRSLVEATLASGRPHQIRIHLAAAGHPLVGDPLYGVGGVPRAQSGLPGEGGYRLHAHRLALDHPRTGARVEIECGLPPELRAGGGTSSDG